MLEEFILSVWRENSITFAEFSFLTLWRTIVINYKIIKITYINLVFKMIHYFDFLNSKIMLSIEIHLSTIFTKDFHILNNLMSHYFYYIHCFQFQTNLSIKKIKNLFLYSFITPFLFNSISYLNYIVFVKLFLKVQSVYFDFSNSKSHL